MSPSLIVFYLVCLIKDNISILTRPAPLTDHGNCPPELSRLFVRSDDSGFSKYLANKDISVVYKVSQFSSKYHFPVYKYK